MVVLIHLNFYRCNRQYSSSSHCVFQTPNHCLCLFLFSLKDEKTDRELHCSAFCLFCNCLFSVMFEQRTMSGRILYVPSLTTTSLSNRPYGYEMYLVCKSYEPIDLNCNFNSFFPKQDNPNENTLTKNQTGIELNLSINNRK